MQDIDLGSLDFEEIGVWPLIVRIIFAGIIIGAMSFVVYMLFVEPVMSDYRQTNDRLVAKKKEFKIKYNQAVNLTAYQEQMKEIELTYKRLLRQLPTSGQVAILLEDISQQASNSGLEYKLIKPGQEKSLGFYMEMPISLEMMGSYHGFGEFVAGISRLPRIVTLHNFKITILSGMQNEYNKKLNMVLEAKTYWLSTEK